MTVTPSLGLAGVYRSPNRAASREKQQRLLSRERGSVHRLRGNQIRYLAGAAERGGGKSEGRSAASTWKRSIGSGRPRNRHVPRLLTVTPSASDSMTAARTAEDITIWPPCPAKQMRAAAWTESPT